MFNSLKIDLWDKSSIIIEISSWSLSLSISTAFRIFKMYDSFMLIELDKDAVIEALFNSHLLLLFIKEYWLAKKSLNDYFFI